MVISTIFLERTRNFFFYDCTVLFVRLPREILVAFPRESQKRVALTNLVHAGCFSVFIIHKTLTWSLICKLRSDTDACVRTLQAVGEFFSPESTLCADSYLVSVPTHPPPPTPGVTAVARKRPRSLCQTCRWQVTPKHAYTLDATKSK